MSNDVLGALTEGPFLGFFFYFFPFFLEEVLANPNKTFECVVQFLLSRWVSVSGYFLDQSFNISIVRSLRVQSKANYVTKPIHFLQKIRFARLALQVRTGPMVSESAERRDVLTKLLNPLYALTCDCVDEGGPFIGAQVGPQIPQTQNESPDDASGKDPIFCFHVLP